VHAEALRLGYRVNRAARSMVTGRTNTVGFVSADIENPFSGTTMRGITDILRSAGYELVIANSEEDPELERRAVGVLLEHGIDGLMLAPAGYMDGSHLLPLLADGSPVVLLDRSVRGVHADTVLVDNVGAARAGVERLIDLGHRRIGLVITDLPDDGAMEWLSEVALDPIHARTSAARAVGYLSALRGAGIEIEPSLIANSAATREAVHAASSALLARRDRPTALLAVDNQITLAAYEAIQDSGLGFPREVSLLGFDDLDWTTIVRPRLSVVAQPAYDIGATAARRLIARMTSDDSPPQTLFLETSLLERDTTVPPAGHPRAAAKIGCK
jgi:LacI family transcriptional regulator